MQIAHRFESLDGIRGVAAVSVLLFHLGHWLGAPALAANSHLAVDLFFCLSGFVIPFAYEAKILSTGSVADFVRVRLIRLMPLILVATAISGAYVFLRSVISVKTVTGGGLLYFVTLGMLDIPTMHAPVEIGGPQVFPLNGPQYTLFLEIAINVVWAFFLILRLNQILFGAAISAISFFLVAYAGFGGDEAQTFWRGFPMVALSFYIGVLIYEVHKRGFRLPYCGPLFCAASLATIFLFFYPRELPFFVCLAWVCIVSPLLVLTGKDVVITQNKLRWLAAKSGELSYPIYALHYALFCWINGVYQLVEKQHNIYVEAPIILFGVIAGSALLSSYYDIPTRRFLMSLGYRPRTKPSIV
jgi:peptidoglycan/LPS O-acetylase OafA/YrhL